MNKLIVLLAASLLCSIATAGEKQRHATLEPTTATFASLDRNADKQISKTEAGIDRKLSDGFAYVDTNGDGFISVSEYLAQDKSTQDPS